MKPNRPHRGKKQEERRGRESEKRARRQREDPRLIVVRVFRTAPPYLYYYKLRGSAANRVCASASPEHPFPRPYLNTGMSERSATVETIVVCRELGSATLFYDHTAVVYRVCSASCKIHTVHMPNTLHISLPRSQIRTNRTQNSFN